LPKKAVVIGPESTGKTTLSISLATHFQVPWVPEFARQYIGAMDGSYREPDLLEIARGQIKTEDQIALNAGSLLICDTDLYVIKVWSEHAFGSCDPWILEQIAVRKYDLYLLTCIDLPWEPDPQREYPDRSMREYFYSVYRDIVINAGLPWADIRGSREERIMRATGAVNLIL